MDFVDEEDIAFLEVGEQRGEIAGLGNHRAGGGAEVYAELARHDLRERGLAQSRRADEQHVVERFVARFRSLDKNPQVGPRLLLADEFGEPLRPQRRLGRIVLTAFRGDQAARRGAQSVRSRLYLFGNNSPMLTVSGPLAPGTITSRCDRSPRSARDTHRKATPP